MEGEETVKFTHDVSCNLGVSDAGVLSTDQGGGEHRGAGAIPKRYPSRDANPPLSVQDESIRSALTKFEAYLDDFDKVKDSSSLTEINNYSKECKSGWKKFEELYTSYIKALGKIGAKEEITKTENMFYRLSHKKQGVLNNLKDMFIFLYDESVCEKMSNASNWSILSTESKRAELIEKIKIARTKNKNKVRLAEIDLKIKQIEEEKELDKEKLFKEKQRIADEEEVDVLNIQLETEDLKNPADPEIGFDKLSIENWIDSNYYSDNTKRSPTRGSRVSFGRNSHVDLEPQHESRKEKRPQKEFYLDGATRHLAIVELKRAPADPFRGEPYYYHAWIASLNNRMNELNLSSADRIDVLDAHTVDAPNKVVRTFRTAYGYKPKVALTVILEKLDQRFGSDEEIASELRNRIQSFKEIRGSENDAAVAFKLRELSDLCIIIHAHMDKVNDLRGLNQSFGMGMIRAKLPDFMNSQWRNEKESFKIKNGFHPDFAHFVEFLERKSDILCSDQNIPSNKQTMKSTQLTTVLQTEVHKENENCSSQPRCPIHKSNNHDLRSCFSFIDLKHKTKKLLVGSFDRCFKCLEAHPTRDCTSDIKCEKCGSTYHIEAMHFQEKSKYREFNHQSRTQNNDMTDNNSTTLCTSVKESLTGKSCGKTLLVDIYSPNDNKHLRTYAIIDDQSTNSFATSEFMDLLGISTPVQSYRVTTMTSQRSECKGRIASGLLIKGVGESSTFKLPELYENDFIPDAKGEVATPQLVNSHPSISEYAHKFVPIDVTASVNLLIGRDAGDLMYASTTCTKAPFVFKTLLGFAVVGTICPQERVGKLKVLRTSLSHDHDHFKAKLDFNSDSIFRRKDDDEMEGPSVEDLVFIKSMTDNCQISEEGNLKFPLPLRNPEKKLPDNRKTVYLRQQNTLRRLRNNEDQLSKSISFMQEMIDSSHVECVPASKQLGPVGKTWHLPVFPVIQEKKGKLRLVFDSAATYSGASLNSSLLQGPDQTNKLRGVLLRFRGGEVGFVADVKSMFHSFLVDEEHRDYMRFYWYHKNNPDNQLSQFRARVHIFGNTSSPAVATFGLRYAADSILNAKSSEYELKAHEYIHKNFYVDDGLGSASSETEAIAILNIAKAALAKFNIKLHKIVSNSPKVLNNFPIEERGKTSLVEFDNDNLHRTLGVAWNIVDDSFVVKVNIPNKPFTKRGVLSVVNSIYDPIGIACPVVLGGRLIQRKLLPRKHDRETALNKTGWDDELPAKYLDEWEHWKLSLSSLEEIKIKRCFWPTNFGEKLGFSMHVFADASQEAIGHVIYLRFVNSAHEIYVSFLYGESKVAPRGAASIPRMELCAASNATKSVSRLLIELRDIPDEINYYTDSKVLLGYLNNKHRRFSRYVTRRVEIIKNTSTSDQWQYISSELNPADLATKPVNADNLRKCPWLTGPSFLWKKQFQIFTKCIETDLPEAEDDVEDTRVLFTKCDEDPFTKLAQRGFNWSSIKAINNIVMKFISLALKRSTNEHELGKRLHLIPRDYLPIKCAQSEYKPTVQKLRTSQLDSSHRLLKLNPIVTDDILRVGGRLKHSNLPPMIKYPILLPHDHPISLTIIKHYHEKTYHQGRHITIGAVRDAGFHIEKGSQTVKSFIKNCLVCKKLRGKFIEQKMADLPADRVNATAPFTNVGLDIMGPWCVHDGRTTRQQTSNKKVWGVLFTCLVSRAVHIEQLPSLETSTFVNALKRFLAIRGPCDLFRSDRGTNIVGALNQEIDFQSASKLISSDCRWEFNPPHSSHFGGSWERKIGQVKRCLDGAMTKITPRTLSRDELQTVFQEAADIVNSTPLWEVSSDPNDPQPLSPKMLLTMKEPNLNTETFSSDDMIEYGKRRWRRVQYISEQFWNLWRKCYLQNLQTRQKWETGSVDIKIGDIVLLREKNQKRNEWPLARIESVKISDDGIVRSATVIVAKSLGKIIKKSTYCRPLSEMVLLIRNN